MGDGGGGGADGGGEGGTDGATDFIGAPQFGHAAAAVLTSCPHSGHFVRAIIGDEIEEV